MFKNVFFQLRKNPERPWFRGKTWVYVPVTWQGWLVTFLYGVSISVLVLMREKAIPGNPDSGSNFLISGLPIIVLTTLFIFVVYRKKENPDQVVGKQKSCGNHKGLIKPRNAENDSSRILGS